MERRKIIKSGQSSFVVSLPLDWIKANRLKPGDSLSVDIDENQITFSPQAQPRRENHTAEISVDNKPMDHIEKQIKSAYINNYHTFIIHGSSLQSHLKDIRRIFSGLVAVEIMELSKTRMVVEDMFQMAESDPKKVIKRIDMILRSILEDIDTETDKSLLKERHTDIERLHFLVVKMIYSGLKNPTLAKGFEMNNVQLLTASKVVINLKLTTDHISELYDCFPEIGETNLNRNIFPLLKEIHKIMINAMKGFYNRDIELSVRTASEKLRLYEECNRQLAKTKDAPSSRALSLIKRIALNIERISLATVNSTK